VKRFASERLRVRRTAKLVFFALAATSARTRVRPSRDTPSAVPSKATSGTPKAPAIVRYRSMRPPLVRTAATAVVLAAGSAT
jgi:hypothetical protein